MRKNHGSIVVWFFVLLSLLGSSCAAAGWETAKVVAPKLAEATRATFEQKLATAQQDLVAAPNSADALIWVGRRTAYLGRYQDAIRIFSTGVEKFPHDARFLRHRGHRLLSLRCSAEAQADFERAAALTTGKADEIEPDGLPNARNIPTSTLQTNIWYHLGLAHYVQGDFEAALVAYRECLARSRNNDMVAATSHWLYLTLRRLGRHDEARAVLAPITDDFAVIEDHDYLKLLRMYQGKITPAVMLAEFGRADGGLSDASIGYGIGNWLQCEGRHDEALAVFRRILAGDQWSSFGYVAAESHLASLTKK